MTRSGRNGGRWTCTSASDREESSNRRQLRPSRRPADTAVTSARAADRTSEPREPDPHPQARRSDIEAGERPAPGLPAHIRLDQQRPAWSQYGYRRRHRRPLRAGRADRPGLFAHPARISRPQRRALRRSQHRNRQPPPSPTGPCSPVTGHRSPQGSRLIAIRHVLTDRDRPPGARYTPTARSVRRATNRRRDLDPPESVLRGCSGCSWSGLA